MVDNTKNLRPYMARAFPTIKGGEAQFMTDELKNISDALRQVVTALKAIDGQTNAAWTPYTPTITSATGTLGSVSSQTGRYIKFGKTVHFTALFLLVTNGTGATALQCSLPSAVSSAFFLLNGRDHSGGQQLSAYVGGGFANAMLVTTSNGYPGFDSRYYAVSGTYEEA